MHQLTIYASDGIHRRTFESEIKLDKALEGLADAPLRPCGGNGTCGKCLVYMKKVGQTNDVQNQNTVQTVRTCQTLLNCDAEVWLPARKIMTQIETRTPERNYAVDGVSDANCPDGAQPKGSTSFKDCRYGTAVDIGTTTVVLRLLRLADGEILATVAAENPQRVVAADVIGRIESALEGNIELQTRMIRECVERLEKEAFRVAAENEKLAAASRLLPEGGMECTDAAGCVRTVDTRVITGNTTMLYLYIGRMPKSLAAAPFQADCLFDLQEERDYFPPCMGTFVGADITDAVLASDMCERDEKALLIDIGTNGEIALWDGETLTCCATAAGPAFEGSGISQGMSSVPGAIDRAQVVNNEIRVTTIGGEKATGICGSGLIDLTAALLDLEILEQDGSMDEDYQVTEDVTLTQQDIRQIQLAKGAIAAGIKTLLEIKGLQTKDIQKLYIAGGFGSHLNLYSAARIGLIPRELMNRTEILGNAALAGAEQMLLNREARSKARRLAAEAECVNLAQTERFADIWLTGEISFR